jgi:lipopolysaccharide transport system ATP-binding protein
MSNVVISVENLSKSYFIGHNDPHEHYRSIRETLVRSGRNLIRKAIDMSCGRPIIQGDIIEEFWALKSVSFEVKRGDVVGIIGRNGAGKSTLLKILSRITEPTGGRVVLEGRVASLLEVGTGFHPELSGRENIFLNGSILGMSKLEIKSRFDEIVDFAGVEQFLDLPVKRYSSGMYVRLAFAVAAHMNPEILIVDEVLAVGDAEFQKKCLGKMQHVAGEGRTVLFVSHNLAAMEKLCSAGLILKLGHVEFQGSIDCAVAHYRESTDVIQCAATTLHTEVGRRGAGRIRLRSFGLYNHLDERVSAVSAGNRLTLRFECENCTEQAISNVSFGYSIANQRGELLVVQYSDYEDCLLTMPSGRSNLNIIIKHLPLSSSTYTVSARLLVNGSEEDWPLYPVGSFIVDGGAYAGNAAASHSGRGSLLLENEWRVVG